MDMDDQPNRSSVGRHEEHALTTVAMTVLWVRRMTVLAPVAGMMVTGQMTAGRRVITMSVGIFRMYVVATTSCQQMIEHHGQGQVVHQ